MAPNTQSYFCRKIRYVNVAHLIICWIQIRNLTWMLKILNFDSQFLLAIGIVIHTSKGNFDFCSICYWNETKTLQIHFNLCFSLVIVMIFVMGSTILRGFSYLFQHFWEGLNLRRPRVSMIQISRNLRSQKFISWIQLMSWAIKGLNCVPKKVH